MTKEVIEGNKLIAEFVGAKLAPYPFGPDKMQMPNTTFPNQMWTCSLNEMSYHSSWDWLMPVVEKISRIPYPDSSWDNCEPFENYAWPRTFGMLNTEGKPMVRLQASTLFIGDTLIEACWLAVVDFIQWYNTQTQPQ